MNYDRLSRVELLETIQNKADRIAQLEARLMVDDAEAETCSGTMDDALGQIISLEQRIAELEADLAEKTKRIEQLTEQKNAQRPYRA